MLRPRNLLLPVMAAFAAAVLVVAISSRDTSAGGSFVTQDLTTSLEPVDLANTLLGGGITVSDVTFTGAEVAAGTFSGGSSIGGAGIGFDSGVVLSSGNIASVAGPNTTGSVTTVNSTPGDTDLNALITPRTTNDAAVLQFNFTPQANEVQFQYVFASDEYNEFVNTQFDDVFAFFVNGTNCATVPGTSGPTRVSINTVNNGNPFGELPNSNPNLYVNNDFQTPDPAPFNTEMDGFTVVLTCTAAVNAGVPNTLKLAIADASDTAYDSVVFLKAGSFTIPTPTPTNTFTPTNTPTNTPSPTITPSPTATNTTPPDATATNTATATSTATSTPTATNTPTPTHTTPAGATATSTSTATSTATATATPTNTLPPEVTATHTPTPTNTTQPTSTHTPTATATATGTATTPPSDECERADVNGDGKVTTADVVQMATNLAKNKKSQNLDYDVDGDGDVDAKDLVTVVKCRNAEKKHFAIF